MLTGVLKGSGVTQIRIPVLGVHNDIPLKLCAAFSPVCPFNSQRCRSPPVLPHVPYGLRGLLSRLWPKCNRLLRLWRPWGAVTLFQWGGWWYMNEIPGGALNLSSTKLTRPWSPWETTRPIGRTRSIWPDEVREDGRMVGGEEWKEKLYNREDWKKLLRTARNRRILYVPVEWMNFSLTSRVVRHLVYSAPPVSFPFNFSPPVSWHGILTVGTHCTARNTVG
jgi:hypothetical protein